jgi:hypothetical protein
MKTFEITYVNLRGNKKTFDVESMLKYLAVERFKKKKKFKKIISVKETY